MIEAWEASILRLSNPIAVAFSLHCVDFPEMMAADAGQMHADPSYPAHSSLILPSLASPSPHLQGASRSQ